MVENKCQINSLNFSSRPESRRKLPYLIIPSRMEWLKERIGPSWKFQIYVVLSFIIFKAKGVNTYDNMKTTLEVAI